MRTISVFIPAYNAEKHLGDVIRRIPASLWDDIISVWVIDDGSKDNTWAVIQGLSQNNSKIRPVQFPKNLGYGAVVKKGLSLCAQEGCGMAVCLHSDGQYPPEAIPQFRYVMDQHGQDILQGTRMADGKALQGGMPFYRFAANRTGTFLENMALGLHLTDYHSGFLCYSPQALKKIPFESLSQSFDIDVESIVCAKILGLKVGEIPIPAHYADEKCYLNPVDYSLRILGIIFKYLAGGYHKICKTGGKASK